MTFYWSERGQRHPKRNWRLRVEMLECRTMLTTYFVGASATGGSGAPDDPYGLIQDAVNAAAASPGPDMVVLRPGQYTENIKITDSNPVTVQGIGEESIQAAS
jgi:pectin methylesterase-like acyl-CoA thioesterase